MLQIIKYRGLIPSRLCPLLSRFGIEMTNPENNRSLFTGYLTQCHSQLFAYVHSLVRDLNDVDDIMQRTTLVLWEKFSSFDRSKSFFSWACGVARFEAMNFIRKKSRDPHCFSASLAELLAEEYAENKGQFEERNAALSECMSKLPESEKRLVSQCYSGNISIHDLAGKMKRTTHSIYNSLRRIRRNLFQCVERTLNRQSGLLGEGSEPK